MPTRTKNRKYVTYAETININGTDYVINTRKNLGIYPEILKKAVSQLDICLDKWNRVFMLRFDLHQSFYTSNNKLITKFRKNLQRRLEREYGMSEIGYLWAREMEKAKHQHYHFAIFLDGNKIRHSSKIIKTIDATWKQIKGATSVGKASKPFYNLDKSFDKSQVKAAAVERLSYLAKVRGKGYRDSQAKDFSVSRIQARQRADKALGADLATPTPMRPQLVKVA